MAGTNPNLNNINLTAPGAPPSALMAEQAQIQLRQEIAQALMAQSMADQSPVIHTGGSNNPFARDVANIGGPIGEVAEAIMGRNLSNKVGSQQIDLAQRAEGIRESGINQMMQDVQGYDQGVPGPDGSTPVHVAGNVLKAAQDAMSSPHPAVQALGKSLLETYAANQAKSIATPGDIGTLGKTQTPGSIGNSLTPLLFGGSGIDPSKLQMKPVVSPLAAGSSLVSTDPNAIAGAAPAAGGAAPATGGAQPAGAQPSGAVTSPLADGGDAAPASPSKTLMSPPPAEVLYPGDTSKRTGFTNKLDVPVSWSATSNKYEVMPGIGDSPGVKTTVDTTKEHMKTLEEGREQSAAYLQTQPKLLKALELIPNADLKIKGDVLTQARQWMMNLGMSKDDANKVGDTQTFLKTMMSPAVGAARAFNSRATQMEFVQFLKAFAASQDTDPRAATNIITQMMLDEYNANKQHEKNVQTFGALPSIGKENANSYIVPNFPNAGQLAGLMDKTGTKVSLTEDKDKGFLTDNMATQRGAASAPPANVQWTYQNGKLVPAPNAN